MVRLPDIAEFSRRLETHTIGEPSGGARDRHRLLRQPEEHNKAAPSDRRDRHIAGPTDRPIRFNAPYASRRVTTKRLWATCAIDPWNHRPINQFDSVPLRSNERPIDRPTDELGRLNTHV